MEPDTDARGQAGSKSGRRVGADTVVIDRRFCGPPTSGNGGYTAGLVAAPLEEGGATVVEVTLRVPPPLETPLARSVDEDGKAVLLDGETVVAEGVAVGGPLDLDVPVPPTFDEARTAEAGYPLREAHPFPTCFACGTGREPGDGLRLHPGPIESIDGQHQGLYAASWVPTADLGDSEGHVRHEYLWAALDCPTSAPIWPADATAPPSVLGRLRASITGTAMVGTPHVVVSWPLAIDGRKRTAAAALFNAQGAVVGASIGTWIQLRAEAAATAKP